MVFFFYLSVEIFTSEKKKQIRNSNLSCLWFLIEMRNVENTFFFLEKVHKSIFKSISRRRTDDVANDRFSYPLSRPKCHVWEFEKKSPNHRRRKKKKKGRGDMHEKLLFSVLKPFLSKTKGCYRIFVFFFFQKTHAEFSACHWHFSMQIKNYLKSRPSTPIFNLKSIIVSTIGPLLPLPLPLSFKKKYSDKYFYNVYPNLRCNDAS